MPTSCNTRSASLGKHVNESGGVGGACATCGSPCERKYCGIDCYRAVQRSGSDEERFWSKVRKSEGCWLWTASRFGGRRGKRYGQFSATVNGVRKTIYAHIFSYELHHGPVPEGLEVLHSCNNGLCVRGDHLSAGTHAQNVKDAARDGLYHVPRPTAQKLTDEQVEEMIRLVQGGMLRYRVAERFGVSKAYVTRLMQGTLRQHRERPSLRSVG